MRLMLFGVWVTFAAVATAGLAAQEPEAVAPSAPALKTGAVRTPQAAPALDPVRNPPDNAAVPQTGVSTQEQIRTDQSAACCPDDDEEGGQTMTTGETGEGDPGVDETKALIPAGNVAEGDPDDEEAIGQIRRGDVSDKSAACCPDDDEEGGQTMTTGETGEGDPGVDETKALIRAGDVAEGDPDDEEIGQIRRDVSEGDPDDDEGIMLRPDLGGQVPGAPQLPTQEDPAQAGAAPVRPR